MAKTHKILIDKATYSEFRCIIRIICGAFLCGRDSYPGQDYEHRRDWIRDRLRGKLAGLFPGTGNNPGLPSGDDGKYPVRGYQNLWVSCISLWLRSASGFHHCFCAYGPSPVRMTPLRFTYSSQRPIIVACFSGCLADRSFNSAGSSLRLKSSQSPVPPAAG
jgi:hypothetical protein